MIVLLLTVVWMISGRDCGAFLSTFAFQMNMYSPVSKKRYNECILTYQHQRNRTILHVSGTHYPVSISNVQLMEEHRVSKNLEERINSKPSSLPYLLWVLPMFDMNGSDFIRTYGTYSLGELNFLLRLIPPNGFYVDVGANVGAYAIPMADHVGEGGLVWAFEPFRLTRQILTANVAINGFINVHVFECGLGATFDKVISRSPSFAQLTHVGAYSIYNQAEEYERKNSFMKYDGREEVCVRPLDSFKFHRKIDLMKIDVEGMSEQVLEGARATIAAHRPIISIEAMFHEGQRFFPVLRELNYHCRLKNRDHMVSLCVPREVELRSHTLNTTWVPGWP